jgi:hypothetical protein
MMTRPRELLDDYAVLWAAYSWGFGFHIYLHSAAEIRRTPPANTVSAVISGRFLSANAAPAHISFVRTCADNQLRIFIAFFYLNFFYNDILDTENYF